MSPVKWERRAALASPEEAKTSRVARGFSTLRERVRVSLRSLPFRERRRAVAVRAILFANDVYVTVGDAGFLVLSPPSSSLELAVNVFVFFRAFLESRRLQMVFSAISIARSLDEEQGWARAAADLAIEGVRMACARASGG